MTEYVKRLIEVDLPIKKISEHARKDQNIRKGHLHTMHVWWATRPLAACRAVIMATLLPDPADELCPQSFRVEAQKVLKPFTGENLADKITLREALLEFIADFASWDAGVNPTYLNAARKLVSAAHPDGPPLVLDPFAGAGSIPFEALRVGAQSFAGDLNPVAVLLNKVSQEYLPKYGPRLAEGVEKWGKWVLEEARKKLHPFYPSDEKGNIPLAYIWARTINCEGPGCGAKVPLLGMLWLSRKAKNEVALRYSGNQKSKRVDIEIFQPKSERDIQSPVVRRFASTCPCCGYTTPYKSVREQLRQRCGGTLDSRMLAVTMLNPKTKARFFRIPDENDQKAYQAACQQLQELQARHKGPLSLVPEEELPQGAGRWINTRNYGMSNAANFFLPRQALSLATLCGLVQEAHEHIAKDTSEPGLADAVATCLGVAVSNMSQYFTSISGWIKDCMQTAFHNNSIPMRGTFADSNVLMPTLVGGIDYALNLVCAFLEREANRTATTIGVAQWASAKAIPLPDDAVSYLVTDPPYYDAIGYAALSDYLYVWLKRAVGYLHPDLFCRELTPKAEECILDPGPPANGGPNKDKNYFESTMQAALADARRTLRPDGVGVVIFAHKGTAGWEALLNALVNAGWTVTASWPIDTERAARMRARDSAALASSVHLVCRPRENSDGSLVETTGDWREVLAELPKRIHEWMPRLADEGVVGADAIFACLGPALEIFSRYSRVEKASGEQVTLREYLEQVWAAVAREALGMIFEGADASGFEEDARLTAMWLWTLHPGNGNGKTEKTSQDEDSEEQSEIENRKSKIIGEYALEYDAARKIAQGLGVHLEKLSSVVEIQGDTARLLSVAERTKYLFGKEETQAPVGKRKKKDKQLKMDFLKEVEKSEAESGGWGEKTRPPLGNTVLDQLHQAMILFAAGRSEALKRFLVEDGVGKDGRFWRLAQAFSALYPPKSDEKRWVDGVLARKKGLGF